MLGSVKYVAVLIVGESFYIGYAKKKFLETQ